MMKCGIPQRLGVLAAALLLTVCTAHAASLEFAVKAAYLYKFAPFIEWPETAFASADSPIVICIAGKDPFGSMLDQQVAGQRVAGRPLVVRRIGAISAAGGCQIVYLGEPADQTSPQSLEIFRGQPVLTVSDGAARASDRGVINLVVDHNRVRFEIDARAAEQDHLAISSKLLSLALPSPKSESGGR